MSRVVVVTGAASGNGLAIASRFLDHGDRVVAVDVSTDGLGARFQKEWRPYEERVIALTKDVSCQTDIESVFQKTIQRFQRVDVIVNNAGILGSPVPAVLHKTSVSEFDQVLAVKVRGAFLACQSNVKES